VGYAFTGASSRNEPVAQAQACGGQHWVVVGDRRMPLRDGENVIGRDPSSQVWLDAVGVSRRHARIVVRGEVAEVDDLGSKNGTTARGVRLTGAVELHDGDTVDVGPVSILYRTSAAGMSTDTTVGRV
jgi:pSer/pThr/pTyr-binding forkhead associated (FHA) protein